MAIDTLGSNHRSAVDVDAGVRTKRAASRTLRLLSQGGARDAGLERRGEQDDLGLLGGVRFNWLRGGRFTPSAQVLAGVLHSKSGALQPGVGFTVMVTPRVGLRMQTDLQFAIPDQSEYEGISIFLRVTVGARFRLGRER